VNNNNFVLVAVAAVAVLVFLVFLLVFLPVLRLWLQALLTKTPVGIGDILALRLRRIPPELIVHAAITLSQRGVRVPVNEIAECWLKHGVGREMNATQLATLVAAERADRADPPQA
jgi:uncharacterized protein YqfA (UPF0365 family)